MKHFLTASDISRLEYVSHMTVTRWIIRGYFPNARKVGKTYRIPISDYDAWHQSTKVATAPDARLGSDGRTMARSIEPTNDRTSGRWDDGKRLMNGF